MNFFTFEPTPDSSVIHSMRDRYLDELHFVQEYYIELQIKQAKLYIIKSENDSVGYFYLSPEGYLLEYFIQPEWITQADYIFKEIISAFDIKRALCKSFDALLLSCCHMFSKSSRVIGILFREYVEKSPIPLLEGISIRKARPADETTIISVNEEVFDHPSEVMEYILTDQIFLYENQNDLIGFGIYSQIIPGRPDRDIGMVVVPAYRKKGWGQFIIRHLVHYCQENEWQFSAGCAGKNTASRNCLEKAGFISRFRLLEFTF